MSKNSPRILIRQALISAAISAALTACVLAIGCQAPPNWGPPGTIGMQRTRAMLHDPYPSNELGPSLTGVRPLGYDQPRSETTSLQTSPYARRSVPVVPTYGY